MFTQLYEFLKGTKKALNITVTATGETMTVSVVMQEAVTTKDTLAKRHPPMIIKGNPEELDADFIAAISKPLIPVFKGLQINTEEFDKSVEEEQESEAKDIAATEKRKQKAGVPTKKLTFKEQVAKAIKENNIPKAIKARDDANAGGGLPNIDVARLTMMIVKAKFDNKEGEFTSIIAEATDAIALLKTMKAPAKEINEYNGLLYEIKKAKMVADMEEPAVSDDVVIPAPVKKATIREIADANPNIHIVTPNLDAERKAKYDALQGLDDGPTQEEQEISDTPMAEQFDENLSDIDEQGTDFEDVDDDF